MATKKMQGWFDTYNMSEDTELHHVYRTCSNNKERACRACRSAMAEEGGWGFRIVSHNSMFFTVGYVTETEFVYRTYANVYRAPLSELS